MTDAPFGRVLTAMATAFHDDGSVDLEGTARIAAHLVDHGHDGVVVSGTTIAMETYRAAKEWDTVVAVKDAVGDFARGVRLRQLGYAVYSGDDIATLGWLAHGGCGVVSVLGHVAGDQIRAMIDAWFAGDAAGALETYTRMLPAIDAVMGVPNYGATTAKAALQLLGVLDNRNVRSPLVPLDDDEVEALRAGLAASGLL